jgi:hypothetical protein
MKSICTSQEKRQLMHKLKSKWCTNEIVKNTFAWLTIAQTWEKIITLPSIIYFVDDNNDYIKMIKILGFGNFEFSKLWTLLFHRCITSSYGI